MADSIVIILLYKPRETPGMPTLALRSLGELFADINWLTCSTGHSNEALTLAHETIGALVAMTRTHSSSTSRFMRSYLADEGTIDSRNSRSANEIGLLEGTQRPLLSFKVSSRKSHLFFQTAFHPTQ